MGQMLDIVPNHMAIDRENPWWWDVLENGPSSAYAEFFDVDWEPPERRIHNTVLMPVLEDQYGILLEAGKLKVVRDGDAFEVRNGDQRVPGRAAVVAPDSCAGGDENAGAMRSRFLPTDSTHCHRRPRPISRASRGAIATKSCWPKCW